MLKEREWSTTQIPPTLWHHYSCDLPVLPAKAGSMQATLNMRRPLQSSSQPSWCCPLGLVYLQRTLWRFPALCKFISINISNMGSPTVAWLLPELLMLYWLNCYEWDEIMWYKLCWQLVYLWDPHVASAGGAKPELGTLGKKKPLRRHDLGSSNLMSQNE